VSANLRTTIAISANNSIKRGLADCIFCDPSREIWLSEAEAWLPSDGLKFYTVGFLFEGKAGYGMFIGGLDLKASFALGTFATVFQAEVYAILACFDCCLRECMTVKQSAFARTVGSCYWPKVCTQCPRLVLHCRNSLQGPSIHNRVQLFWIPGHCGIIGNEEAHDLVEVRSKSSFCGLEPCLPRSLMTRVTKEWLSGNHLSY
jgi:hypothetical protein